MVTLLFTSVFVLALVAVAIYFWQKPANTSQTIELPLPPTQLSGLFSDYQLKPIQTPDYGVETRESHLIQIESHVDKDSVQKSIEYWQESPDRNSTAKMLHTAALSDDAETYRNAVDMALQSWREGKLRDISAVELQSLFNGEFWVLSSGSRSSGAGFVLKRTLSTANRELEGTNNPS